MAEGATAEESVDVDKHPRQIATMFSAIARRYDLLNRLLSCGLDRHWRQATAARVAAGKPRRVLDVCAGTGDLAFALRTQTGRGTLIALTDFALPMLRLAKRKSADHKTLPCLSADALSLPVRAETFDAAMAAFGVRNFVDLTAGLREMVRVLRPGGMLAVLEFFGWRDRELPLPVDVFIRRAVPLVGRLLSGHESAYSYLQDSIAGFVSKREMVETLRRLGLTEIHARDLSFGVCTLIVGRKEEPG